MDSSSGKLIVLEGADGVGKTTQALALKNMMEFYGLPVKMYKFPDLDDELVTAPAIKRFLDKPYVEANHAMFNIFSANRYERRGVIVDDLDDGMNVICDRYTHSGLAYHTANMIQNYIESIDEEDDMFPMLLGEFLLDECDRSPEHVEMREILRQQMQWCMAVDRNMPTPDVVVRLSGEMRKEPTSAYDEDHKFQEYVNYAYDLFAAHFTNRFVEVAVEKDESIKSTTVKILTVLRDANFVGDKWNQVFKRELPE